MVNLQLLTKLNVKPNTGTRLMNSPENLTKILSGANDPCSVTVLFVYSVAELEALLPDVIATLPPDQLLWVAFPKKTSKIKTDISRDNGWDILERHNYRLVNLIAIDDDWSAFRIRHGETVVSIGRSDPSEPRPELTVPPELVDRLASAPTALETFDRLSYTCRREYIEWITSAKRQETKEKRLASTAKMLIEGRKSPLR